MKRITAAMLLLVICIALSGCTAQMVNPLVKNEATAVPGLSLQLHPASAAEGNTSQVSVALYFRFYNEPFLAAETRTLTVKRDESVEAAIVKALIEGPSAGHSELQRLLPADTEVESIASRDGLLFVTLSEGFLHDDVPDQWQNDDAWREEAPVRRQLTVQSIVDSVTEYAPYTGVQFLLHRQNEVQTSLRLENAYFCNGTEGLSEPLIREENWILTPANTVKTFLSCLQSKDSDRLYQWIALEGKPSPDIFTAAVSNAPSIAAYQVSGGSVSQDGQHATVSVSLQTLVGTQPQDTSGYPLQLVRENGLWMLPYSRFANLLGL